VYKRQDFPVSKSAVRQPELEDQMQKARTIASLALSLRKKEQIKVRQPLQKIMIPVRNAAEKTAIEKVQDLILSELNVKELELLDDASDILVKEIKPNFKTLGPRFGKNMKAVVGHIHQLKDEQIKTLENEASVTLDLDGETVELLPTDVIIQSKDIEGWLVANGNGLTVALDIQISPELKEEGLAREFINRIQNLRKDAGFEVTDKIILTYRSNDILEKVLQNFGEYIKLETLSEDIKRVDGSNPEATFVEFDGIETEILLKKS